MKIHYAANFKNRRSDSRYQQDQERRRLSCGLLRRAKARCDPSRWAIIFVLLLAGCGTNVPLGGRVVFSDTEEPLPRGTVCFNRPDFHARGFIGKNGRYVVGSYADHDGLPPGTYKITVHSVGTGDHSLIDPKYNDPERSGLTVEVDRSTKTFDIKVDRVPVGPGGQRQPATAKADP